MTARYLDQFTDRDLAILADSVGSAPDELEVELTRRPWALHDLLTQAAVVDVVFDPRAGLAAGISPFLVFAVLVHQVGQDLQGASYVNDWTGFRSRLPVFEVQPLVDFLADPGRGMFLAQLLASFTRCAPQIGHDGALDPVALADRLDGAGGGRRVALLRRLGDLALFLTGIMPDYVGRQPLQAGEAERLGRTARLSAGEVLTALDGLPTTAPVELIELLGARWYRLALEEGEPSGAGHLPTVLSDVAGRFRAGRRVLNHLADTYLFRFQPAWLSPAA